jgi:hypothetical protein
MFDISCLANIVMDNRIIYMKWKIIEWFRDNFSKDKSERNCRPDCMFHRSI